MRRPPESQPCPQLQPLPLSRPPRPGLRCSGALLLATLLPTLCGAARTAAPTAQEPTPRPAAQTAPATSGASARESEDHSSGLVPIALGLVLTGIAVYKHRGLPRGH